MAENGALFPEKSDIDSLIEKLNEFLDYENSHRADSDGKKPEGTLSRNPKIDDFQSYLGNLDLIIPTGFIMLHNDLVDIGKSLKGSGGEESEGSSLSWEEVANNLVDKLPALAGIIAGASVANTLIRHTSMDDVIKLLRVIPEIAGSLITEVGEALIGIIRSGSLAVFDVIDYYKDENLKAKRQRLALMYMSISYANLFDGMGFTATIDESTGEITGISQKSTGESLLDNLLSADTINKAAGTIDTLFFGGKTTQGKAAKVEIWADTISDIINENARGLAATVMDVKDIITDDSVDAMRKKYLGLYLQAYYANLIRDMGYGIDFENEKLANLSGGEKALSTGKELLEEGVAAFKTGGATLVAKGVSDALADVATTLASAVKSVIGLLEGDPVVDSMSAKYAGLYMQAYWANMIKDLGFTIDFENDRLSGTAVSLSSLINDGMSFFSGLFGGLAESGTKIVAGAVASESLITSPEVSSISERYAALYIEAYWLSIIDALGFALDSEGSLYDTSSGREQRKGLFTNIGEFFKGDPATQLSNSIVDKLKANMGTVISKMAANGDFSNSVNAYSGFLVSYFNMLKDHVKEKANDWRWSPSGSISIFNHAMAAAIPNVALSEDIKTTIINEGRDYTSDIEEVKNYLYEIKYFITKIRENVQDDIVADVKIIAENSNNPVPVAGTGYNGFNYGNAEPVEE